eukprot:10490927-Alexandrium_andersonii.AAC.1
MLTLPRALHLIAVANSPRPNDGTPWPIEMQRVHASVVSRARGAHYECSLDELRSGQHSWARVVL